MHGAKIGEFLGGSAPRGPTGKHGHSREFHVQANNREFVFSSVGTDSVVKGGRMVHHETPKKPETRTLAARKRIRLASAENSPSDCVQEKKDDTKDVQRVRNQVLLDETMQVDEDGKEKTLVKQEDQNAETSELVIEPAIHTM